MKITYPLLILSLTSLFLFECSNEPQNTSVHSEGASSSSSDAPQISKDALGYTPSEVAEIHAAHLSEREVGEAERVLCGGDDPRCLKR